MKRLLFALAILSLTSAAFAQELPLEKQKWKLTWSDEFNYKGRPDPKKWTFETGGGGWGNHEFQYYTDRAENARVEGGRLVIETRKENYKDHKYTSARMNTLGLASWKYGRIEIRAKLPSGKGTWPAFWMMAEKKTYGDDIWPDNGEIDIMEHVGREPDLLLGCFYTKNFNWMKGTGKAVWHKVKGLETSYNVYTLYWSEKEVALYINGERYNHFVNPRTNWEDWPFDQAMYLIFNIALGGLGGEVDDTIFPQKLLVDYVRVYQQTQP